MSQDTVDEVEIFDVFCRQARYVVSKAASSLLFDRFTELYQTRDESFGNARTARNLFEKTIGNQANRLARLTDISVDALCSIADADIPPARDLLTH